MSIKQLIDLEYSELLQRLRILSDEANQLGHKLNLIISDFHQKQMKEFEDRTDKVSPIPCGRPASDVS